MIIIQKHAIIMKSSLGFGETKLDMNFLSILTKTEVKLNLFCCKKKKVSIREHEINFESIEHKTWRIIHGHT